MLPLCGDANISLTHSHVIFILRFHSGSEISNARFSKGFLLQEEVKLDNSASSYLCPLWGLLLLHEPLCGISHHSKSVGKG